MSTLINIQYTFTNGDTSDTITFNVLPMVNSVVRVNAVPAGFNDTDIRQSESVLSSRDGISTGDMFLGKKVITFDVLLVGTTEAFMNTLIDSFRKVFIPTLGRGISKTINRMTFIDIDSIAKYIDYELEDFPNFSKEINDQMAIGCIFSIKASDPRYYSQAISSETIGLVQVSGGLQVETQVPAQFSVSEDGGVVINNAGNYISHPTFTITGPCTNPQVLNSTTNKTLKYNTTLLAGDIIVVNNFLGTTTKNGADNSGDLADDSQFISLFPGNNSFLYTDDTLNATSECLIQYQSAWI